MILELIPQELTQLNLIMEEPSNINIIALPGPQGPQGEPGTGTSSYIHIQNSPSTSWDIIHNLGYVPNIMVVDSSGRKVDGDIIVVDVNHSIFESSAPFGGIAYCS